MSKKNRIEITHMTSNDISVVKNLEEESGLSFWSESGYIDELKRNDSIALVAKRLEKVVGFIIARLITNQMGESNLFLEESCEMEIYNICVFKGIRRKGIGKALIFKCLDIAKTRNCLSVWLEVRESNREALAFYQKNGFEILYRRKSFYRCPVEDALVMNYRC